MSVNGHLKEIFTPQVNPGELDEIRSHSNENDIVICGMGMRLPGGIRSEDEFWDFLINKKDARIHVPADRYNIEAFYSAENKTGAVNTEYGYFLEDVDLACFDASFFSLTKSELERLDPQHRLLLEVTRECLENAGEMNWRGEDIGCYIETFGED